MNLTYEQIELLVNTAAKKDIIDIIIAFGNIIPALLVGLFSYYAFIQTPRQLAKSKIKEKEVEMLYKAFDNFFIFSDAIGLFISNKERKYKKLLTGHNLEPSFSEKEKASSDAVYASFSNYHLASHILRAIGNRDTEAQVDIYKTKAIEIRELILDFENNNEKAKDSSEYEAIHSEISKRRNELDKIKDHCFDLISKFKDDLKNS
ncbi:hypothetical protein MNZ22_11935 [Aeromonas encheleia]|uniref:hypothetical protein n=1 Tax=Aeromonas encheleia TaxID=73010 RepID=UPI001F55D9BD|nr:hypothetical protein [Aeromonas encheleia]UNP87542.1 hypothetical protein MNZ22_11935 [Aeromonas encheleia]